MWIAPLQRAGLVPLADSTNTEREDATQVPAIVDTRKTVPIATSHCQRITLYIYPSSSAGNALVNFRPYQPNSGSAPAWALLESVTVATNLPVRKIYDCPVGQLQVVNSGNLGITVYAEGLPLAGNKF